MLERENINAGTGASSDPSATADELQRRNEEELFEWKRRATIWRERALMAKALCDTLQANVVDLRRLVKALDDERDARGLESVDLHAPVEVPAGAVPLSEHNGHVSNGHVGNGHEANGARSEPGPAALAWTAPEPTSTPPAAVPVVASDEAVIDLAAIEAAEAAEAPASEHAPEPEPAPVEALVVVGAPSLERQVDVPAAPPAPVVWPSAPTSVIPQVSAELFGELDGAAEPLPDRGERRQRTGWARVSRRKFKRAP